MNTITKRLLAPIKLIIFYSYTRIYIPYKVHRIRKKRQIRVVFILTETGVWKTEKLYTSMLVHPRFQPILLVLPSLENDRAYTGMIKFLKQKKYSFVLLEEKDTIQSKLKPDILFYQKPYNQVIASKFRFYRNLKSLFCYVYYSFHIENDPILFKHSLLNYAWQVYIENQSTLEETRKLMKNNGRNCLLTGLPIMDELLEASHTKRIEVSKKTIIWAPHHTFPQKENWLNYSTFLIYAEFMVEMAKKYKNQVNFIFKPHPLLEPKLRKYWGNTKTQAYYEQWRNMPNTSVELGKYINLFEKSDGMIHDCSSFIIEYLYFGKPVMFLQNGIDHSTDMYDTAKEAYKLHKFGFNRQDIEDFIQSIILGIDENKEKRELFVQRTLLPPHNKTATENIINSILGEI